MEPIEITLNYPINSELHFGRNQLEKLIFQCGKSFAILPQSLLLSYHWFECPAYGNWLLVDLGIK
jgi:hypothetical protein